MPLSIEQEGLLNELSRQINALKQTESAMLESSLKQLLAMWHYIDFADVIKAGVIQHGREWLCETPLENLIKTIATTPLAQAQQAQFFDTLTQTIKPIPDAQRQAVLAAIHAYTK